MRAHRWFYALLPAGLVALMCLPIAVADPVALTVRPAPRAGVQNWNQPVCGPNAYVPVDLGRHGDYFNVYNSQAGNMCVVSERNHLSWYVSDVRPTLHGWQYPNIGSGWEWDRYTCYDGRSAYPSSKGSQCMRYPVREDADGHPFTSVAYWPHLVNGNVAYDIWFNQTDTHPLQDDGTELMIWLDDPGLAGMVRGHTVWYARIGGREYAVMNWVMARNGTTWNYVAYVAVHPVRAWSGWLNEFFRDAIAHGRLSPSWYLTGIDFGAEMNAGGKGFDVARYALTGVR